MFLIRLNLKPESSYIGLCRLALVQLFRNSGSPLHYNYTNEMTWSVFVFEKLFETLKHEINLMPKSKYISSQHIMSHLEF